MSYGEYDISLWEVVQTLTGALRTEHPDADNYHLGMQGRCAAFARSGGWSSLAMPRRYVEDSEIANEGMA